MKMTGTGSGLVRPRRKGFGGGASTAQRLQASREGLRTLRLQGAGTFSVADGEASGRRGVPDHAVVPAL